MIGRESPSVRRRALTVFLALASCLALPAAALAAPPDEAVYQHDLNDCVTGDNQFFSSIDGKFHWPVNATVGADGSNGPLKCDTYQNDQYERPTDQTYAQRTTNQKPPTYTGSASPSDPVFMSGMSPDSEFAVGQSVYSTLGKYFEYGDITRGRAGTLDTSATEGWLFFQVELFGVATVSESLDRSTEFGNGTYYSVRLGSNADPNKANGGILLRNQRQTNITTTWSTSDAIVFGDTNGDVSGAGGVNVTKSNGDAAGDGYDTDQGNSSWLWVRRKNVTFTGTAGTVTRPTVEFAFNYKKYNQDKGKNFTPASLSYVDLDATMGLKANQNYLWNDEYTREEAGSPYTGEVPVGMATANVYQLDTLRLGGFPASPTGVKQTTPGHP